MENGQEPATKADLNALGDELLEAIRDTETKLLRAFYDFADSNQKRLAERTGLVVFDRLATIERRLIEVEKRLNLPPAS